MSRPRHPSSDQLRQVAEQNEQSAQAVERVVKRVLDGHRDPRIAWLLHMLPRPRGATPARFIALAARPPRTAGLSRAVRGGGLALAMCVLAALFWQSPPESLALDARLDSEVRTTFGEVPEVDVAYLGRGEVSGTVSAPVIFWEVGKIGLHVTPGLGIQLAVETPDGKAVVKGTRFWVDRDVFGTRVTVDAGMVEVTCVQGRAHSVGPGQVFECLPTRPAANLARARALRARGDVAGSLAVLAAALGRSATTDPARGEIIALIAEIQVGQGDLPAARSAARAYLDEAHEPRAADMLELVDALDARLPSEQEDQP